MRLKSADFAGAWDLSRTIDDHLLGQVAQFEGTATLIPADKDLLAYHEVGTVQFPGATAMRAERKYLWQFGEPEVTVLFEDGRDFHSFRPSGRARGTDHPCGEDYYTVQYDFQDWPVWQAVWSVKGPRKDYRSTSIYARP